MSAATAKPRSATNTRILGADAFRGEGQSALDASKRLAERPDFDRLAAVYRWMEWASFGPLLQRCRCAWLGELADRRRALVLGDGDGRFTKRLLDVNGSIRVDAVDASQAMLGALLRRAGPDAARVRAHLGDMRVWQPPGEIYDLVITHFSLDCLTTEEVHALVRTVRCGLAENAIWVVSEFSVPDAGFTRRLARPLIAGLYLAFGLLTGLRVRRLPDYASALRKNGFALVQRRTWLGEILASEAWKPMG